MIINKNYYTKSYTVPPDCGRDGERKNFYFGVGIWARSRKDEKTC